jgi:hypothetical protein
MSRTKAHAYPTVPYSKTYYPKDYAEFTERFEFMRNNRLYHNPKTGKSEWHRIRPFMSGVAS